MVVVMFKSNIHFSLSSLDLVYRFYCICQVPFSGRPFRDGGGGGRRRGAFLGVCAFFLFLPFFLALATFTIFDFPGALSVKRGMGRGKKRGEWVVCFAFFLALQRFIRRLFSSRERLRLACLLRSRKQSLQRA